MTAKAPVNNATSSLENAGVCRLEPSIAREVRFSREGARFVSGFPEKNLREVALREGRSKLVWPLRASFGNCGGCGPVASTCFCGRVGAPGDFHRRFPVCPHGVGRPQASPGKNRPLDLAAWPCFRPTGGATRLVGLADRFPAAGDLPMSGPGWKGGPGAYAPLGAGPAPPGVARSNRAGGTGMKAANPGNGPLF